jgi:hypothetical protein
MLKFFKGTEICVSSIEKSVKIINGMKARVFPNLKQGILLNFWGFSTTKIQYKVVTYPNLSYLFLIFVDITSCVKAKK